MNKNIILIGLMSIFLGGFALAIDLPGLETAPAQLAETALSEMSRLKGIPKTHLQKVYEISWQSEAWYDDDQLVDFYFVNPEESCIVAVGSVSNTVRESACH